MALDVHDGPVVVVVRMREPLVVVRRERAIVRKAVQRNLRDPVGEDPFLVPGQVLIGRLSRFAGRGARRDQLTPVRVGREEAQGPALSKPQVEDAVHVRPLVVVIGRGHGGRNGDEMGRRCQRSLPLRHAEVRAAGHPDLAVGPRLGRGPLDGVVAVGLLLENGTEHALRSKRTADVLRQPDVAVLSPERHRRADAGEAPVPEPQAVWRPLHDDRVPPGRCRKVDVRRQQRAVAHRGVFRMAGHAVFLHGPFALLPGSLFPFLGYAPGGRASLDARSRGQQHRGETDQTSSK